MRRLTAFVVLLVSLRALAQSPVVRAHLEPATNIMVGQPVRLVVSVYVPNYFTGSPDFPEFEVDNAIVVLPQDRPVHSNVQIDNATYFGITQTYVIYPEQAGDFHLPPAKLTVPYAIAPPKSTTAEVNLPPLSFHADVPSAARDLPYFLPTTQLTMTQSWSRPLKNLRTGDTITRTITVTAAKMQAMLIPPLQLDQPDGIRIYSSEPAVRDQKTPRGDFIGGQRVQTSKYLIEKPGSYTLPAIELTWWNLSTGKPVIATLPAVNFSADASPAGQAELPPPQELASATATRAPKARIHYRALALNSLGTMLLIVVIWLAIWLARRWYPHIATWIKRARNSEAALFYSLLRAARENNAALTYSRMLHWFSVVSSGLPLDRVVDPASELALAINSLASAIYSDHKSSGGWNGESLRRQLQSLRRNLQEQRDQDDSRKSLVPLNPAFRRQKS